MIKKLEDDLVGPRNAKLHFSLYGVNYRYLFRMSSSFFTLSGSGRNLNRNNVIKPEWFFSISRITQNLITPWRT